MYMYMLHRGQLFGCSIAWSSESMFRNFVTKSIGYIVVVWVVGEVEAVVVEAAQQVTDMGSSGS